MHFTKAENAKQGDKRTRNSESEVNSDSEREFGQAGPAGLRQFRHLCSPHLSRCPKFTTAPLLLTRKGRAPYILRCVAEIVTGNGWKTVYSRCRSRARSAFRKRNEPESGDAPVKN